MAFPAFRQNILFHSLPRAKFCLLRHQESGNAAEQFKIKQTIQDIQPYGQHMENLGEYGRGSVLVGGQVHGQPPHLPPPWISLLAVITHRDIINGEVYSYPGVYVHIKIAEVYYQMKRNHEKCYKNVKRAIHGHEIHAYLKECTVFHIPSELGYC